MRSGPANERCNRMILSTEEIIFLCDPTREFSDLRNEWRITFTNFNF